MGKETRVPRLSTIKGVLIDFDGTLVDSIEDLYLIYCNFLKNFKSEGTREEFTALNGPSINEIIEILLQKHQLSEKSEKLLEHYWNLLIQYYQNVAKPTKGALEFIKNMKEKGKTILLVTSADYRLVETFLVRHELNNSFDFVVTAAGLKKSKPDPTIFRLALLKGNLKPEEVIAIEDSKNGVQAALDAGIFTFCLNPSTKLNQMHQGWLEVNSWEKIMEEVKQQDE